MEGKKTKGRRKIEMKRIESEEARQITFSKRRSSIYGKASEMTILNGAEVGFGVFSPAGKPFSFGHPSIDAVINRFLGQEQQPQDVAEIIVEANKPVNIQKLSEYYNELQSEVDEKINKGKLLDQRMNSKKIHGWWDTPVKDLNTEELLQVENNCKEMFMRIFNKITDRNNGASSSSHPPYVDPTHIMSNPFTTSTYANQIDPSVFPPPFPPAH